MTEQEFLAQLQDALQCESNLQMDTQLEDLEEWDSVAFMVTITFFDKHFGKRITFADLKNCTSVSSLAALAQGAIA